MVAPGKAPLATVLASPLAELPLALALRRDQPQPLHRQLSEALRDAVLAGVLPAGLRLPGSRTLAASLGVTRGVVSEAYAELVADGTLEAVVGSGTRVPQGAARHTRATDSGVPAWFAAPAPAPVDAPALAGGLHFKTGVTTSAVLDARAWRQAWGAAASAPVPGDYGDVRGEQAFRSALAAWAGRSRGLSVTADDVLVTSGTLQAVNLIARGVLPPGSTVLFENPGYRAARQVFQDAGHAVLPLKLDADGPVMGQLPPARAVYVTPSHQFPLGVRMSLPRRLALLDWAQEHDALIIEDDYNGEFRYDAPPLPPLAGLDTAGRVLYLGTLSKVLTPAVRTGFLIAPPALLPALVRARTLLDFGHPLPVQLALTHLLHGGEVDRHVRRARRWHAQVREALTRELAPLAPHATLGGIEAGLHVCLHLAPPLSAQAVQAELARRSVYAATLAEFATGEGVPNALVLGHGGLTVAQAVTGAREVAGVVRAMLGGAGNGRA